MHVFVLATFLLGGFLSSPAAHAFYGVITTAQAIDSLHLLLEDYLTILFPCCFKHRNQILFN